ncbi:hypothetical protein PFISCL1PPCAC_1397, partial [Pristionchus fissidentatus]
EKGEWMARGKSLPQSIAAVKCIGAPPASKTALIVAGSVVLAIILSILGLVLFCRLTGRGWLHQIILKKMRGEDKSITASASNKAQSPAKSPKGKSPDVSPTKSQAPAQSPKRTLTMGERMLRDFERKKMEGSKALFSSWEKVTNEDPSKEKLTVGIVKV